MKLVSLSAAWLSCLVLFAVVAHASPFIDSAALQAKGWASREASVTVDQYGGAGGLAIDPNDDDAAYYYDGLSIRRMDFSDSTEVEVFAVPAPAGWPNFQGGPYGAFLAFDPDDDDLLYFAESTDNTIRRIDLAADHLSATDGGVIYTAPTGNFIFDVTFDTSGTSAAMVISESTGFGNPTAIAEVDRSTTPATRNELGQVDGASGPVDFDPAGNLYYIYPSWNGAGPNAAVGQAEVVRWDAADVAAAYGDATANPLAVTNLTSLWVLDGQHGAALIRVEGGDTVLYTGNSTLGTISRLNVTATTTELDWASAVYLSDGINFTLSPWALVTSSRTADFSADAGQGGTARIFVAYVYWIPASVGSTTGAIAQILPNSSTTSLDSIPLTSQPTEVTVDEPFSLQVEMLDSTGSRIDLGSIQTDASFTVTLATGSGSLTGPDPFGAGSSIAEGVVTLGGLSLDQVQSSVTLTITNTQTGATVTTSNIQVFSAGTALAITSEPASGLTDAPFSLSVEVQDASAGVVSNGAHASLDLTISLATGSGTLGGTTTVTATDGVATFNDLTYDTAETGVSFTLSGGSLSDATSSTLDFMPGAAALAIVTQPTQVDPEAAFSLQVEVLDTAGSRITAGDHAALEVALTISEGSGTLSGTITANAVGGVADFTGLSLTPGGIYVLKATGSNGVEIETTAILVGFLTVPVDGGEASATCSLSSSSSSGLPAVALLLFSLLLLARRRVSRDTRE